MRLGTRYKHSGIVKNRKGRVQYKILTISTRGTDGAIRKPTVGRKLEDECKCGTTSWMDLKELKKDNHIDVAQY